MRREERKWELKKRRKNIYIKRNVARIAVINNMGRKRMKKNIETKNETKRDTKFN